MIIYETLDSAFRVSFKVNKLFLNLPWNVPEAGEDDHRYDVVTGGEAAEHGGGVDDGDEPLPGHGHH